MQGPSPDSLVHQEQHQLIKDLMRRLDSVEQEAAEARKDTMRRLESVEQEAAEARKETADLRMI